MRAAFLVENVFIVYFDFFILALVPSAKEGATYYLYCSSTPGGDLDILASLLRRVVDLFTSFSGWNQLANETNGVFITRQVVSAIHDTICILLHSRETKLEEIFHFIFISSFFKKNCKSSINLMTSEHCDIKVPWISEEGINQTYPQSFHVSLVML